MLNDPKTQDKYIYVVVMWAVNRHGSHFSLCNPSWTLNLHSPLPHVKRVFFCFFFFNSFLYFYSFFTHFTTSLYSDWLCRGGLGNNAWEKKSINLLTGFSTNAWCATVFWSYWHSLLDLDYVPTIPQTTECQVYLQTILFHLAALFGALFPQKCKHHCPWPFMGKSDGVDCVQDTKM